MSDNVQFGQMSRRRFLQNAALVSGGLTFGVGCWGESESGEGTLEFWDWTYPPRMDQMKRLVGRWEANNPDVDLKYNPLEWTEMETKLLTSVASDTGPAFSNMHYFWRYDAQREGALAPYPEDMFDWDDLVSTPFNRDPETGDVYTSDFCWYCSQIYFNRELLDAEGIDESDIPRRWDDFIAMAQQLTREEGGKITQAGLSLNDYYAREWLWMDLLYQQGGWLWNESGTKALWNSDEGVEALKFVQDVYHTWRVDDPEFLAQSDAFGNGKAATYVNQGYTGGAINTGFPKMEGNWATAVEPTLSGSPLPSWGLQIPEEGFVVFSTIPEQTQMQAFDFIKFMLGSDERRLEWSQIMAGPPDSKHLLDHDKVTTDNVIATQAETLPYRVNYGERPIEAEELWRVMFDKVILDEADPKATLDDVTAQMDQLLEQSGKRRVIVERNYQPPAA